MTNRTARSLDIGDYPEYIALQLQTGQLKRAYLGNINNVIPVTTNNVSNDHFGKVYIRFVDGMDDNGATVLGQAVEAWVNPNCNFTYKSKLPVLVRTIGANNGYMVEQVDVVAAARANYNTHALNPMSPENNQIWLRQIRDGRVFAPATADTPSTSVTVEPFIFYFDGAFYDGGKPNSIQLSSYIPTNGNERLVLIGINAYTNAVQIVQSVTRTITTVRYALSDISDLIDEFDDYTMPVQAVKLANGEATVLEKDIHQDLRQFINVQQPRGFPQVIRRHIQIVADYQQVYKGCLSITTGSLAIEGELVIL
jgi:hypothetical protein